MEIIGSLMNNKLDIRIEKYRKIFGLGMQCIKYISAKLIRDTGNNEVLTNVNCKYTNKKFMPDCQSILIKFNTSEQYGKITRV